LADVEAFDWCKGKPFYMPVLRENWQLEWGIRRRGKEKDWKWYC
jgi:hypothetical protein